MSKEGGEQLLLWYVALFLFCIPYLLDMLGVFEVNDVTHPLLMGVIVLLLISKQLKDIHESLESK